MRRKKSKQAITLPSWFWIIELIFGVIVIFGLCFILFGSHIIEALK